jgi:glycosyltransferase involved in cell wall biosynthesis
MQSLTKVPPIRVAIVTNIPAPYRVPVFNILECDHTLDLRVFYSARREPDRDWDLPEIRHSHTFLQAKIITRQGKFIHNNPDVFSALRAFNPQVVLTTGFNPTHLYAFAYSRIFRRQHVAMTDGTLASEAGLWWVHRIVRRIVLSRSNAFVVASKGGRALLKAYGVADDKIRVAPLSANMAVRWSGVAPCSALDFVFSSRLVDGKNPFFAVKVVQGVATRIGRRMSLGMLGSGPLSPALLALVNSIADRVELRLIGNVAQADIPAWLASARVFLFPTSWDPWGVVANEACLAGVPVIITPQAGAAGDLVCDGINGFVRPLELSKWVDAASELIIDPALRERFSEQARLRVRAYSPENAAKGIAEAIKLAACRCSILKTPANAN